MARDVLHGGHDRVGKAVEPARAKTDPGRATLGETAEQGGAVRGADSLFNGVPWADPSAIPEDADQQVEIARQGVGGAGGELPFADQIQRSFGRHDISHVRAHVGGQAGHAADALGAEAYAHGDRVAFGKQPDLHTAAHEAAHILQQRDGVSFKGVDKPGDPHESHADAVADAVVSGRSAEMVLDQRPRGSASGQAVQRRAKPHYAPIDSFNREQERGRPKVGGDIALTANVKRYTIESGTRSRAHDELPAGTDVTINIAHVRKLTIDGARHKCVLTRSVDNGAAWAKLADVTAGGAQAKKLAAKIERSADKHQAKTPSKKAAEKAKHKHMRFKTAPPAPTGLALTGHVSSQSKSNFDHYLFRGVDKDMASPFHNGFYNIALNLPQPGTPPVQADIALPGDQFFVIEHREVSLYDKVDPKVARAKKITDVREKRRTIWVFGCAGKLVGGDWVPDRTRTGWVPRAVLETA